MKNKRLLIVDDLNDYSLLDEEYLSLLGMRLYYVFTSKEKHSVYQGKATPLYVHKIDYNSLFHISSSINPTHIVCFSELYFNAISRINIRFKLKGMSKSKANLLFNKTNQYSALEDIVLFPNTCNIKNYSFSELQRKLKSKKIFIKPVSGVGSVETFEIDSEESFRQFLENKNRSLSDYIVQEYISGELLHSELIIQDEKVMFVSARKYTSPNHKMVSEGVALFSEEIINKKLSDKLKLVSCKTARQLGIKNGILHSEFFLTEDKNLVFIETNFRPPGIGLNKMYKDYLGISLETVVCIIVSGNTVPKIEESKNYFICGYFPMMPGKVSKVNQLKLNVCNKWEYFIRPGDVVEKTRSMSKAAMVICWDIEIDRIIEASQLLQKHKLFDVSRL